MKLWKIITCLVLRLTQNMLELLVLELEYSRKVRSIPLLLMLWCLASPGCMQDKQVLCSIGKAFNYQSHRNVERQCKMQICFLCQHEINYSYQLMLVCAISCQTKPSQQHTWYGLFNTFTDTGWKKISLSVDGWTHAIVSSHVCHVEVPQSCLIAWLA